jgi:hypothetical protein
MSRITCKAKAALAAPGIYLPDDAPSDERALRCFNYAADKLVAERAMKTCVPFHYLQVGVAYACAQHLDQGLVVAGRDRGIRHES